MDSIYPANISAKNIPPRNIRVNPLAFYFPRTGKSIYSRNKKRIEMIYCQTDYAKDVASRMQPLTKINYTEIQGNCNVAILRKQPCQKYF